MKIRPNKIARKNGLLGENEGVLESIDRIRVVRIIPNPYEVVEDQETTVAEARKDGALSTQHGTVRVHVDLIEQPELQILWDDNEMIARGEGL